MSFGSTAYASFVRIHNETSGREFPSWFALSHVKRMAWEAAAQAVALAVLPQSANNDWLDIEEDVQEADMSME